MAEANITIDVLNMDKAKRCIEALAELVAMHDEPTHTNIIDSAKRYAAAWAAAHAALAQREAQPALSPSEAVYGFAGWLTCRDQSVTFGATHEASTAAELVAAFCDSQGFEPPRHQWAEALQPYPSALTASQQEAQPDKWDEFGLVGSASWRACRNARKQEAQPVEPATEPDNTLVICPKCCSQFRAIPWQVQRLLLDAGYEPPFMTSARQNAWQEAQPAAKLELGDRFMEILRAIHGDMPDAFADSARLAYVHALKEAQPAEPTFHNEDESFLDAILQKDAQAAEPANTPYDEGPFTVAQPVPEPLSDEQIVSAFISSNDPCWMRCTQAQMVKAGRAVIAADRANRSTT